MDESLFRWSEMQRQTDKAVSRALVEDDPDEDHLREEWRLLRAEMDPLRLTIMSATERVAMASRLRKLGQRMVEAVEWRRL